MKTALPANDSTNTTESTDSEDLAALFQKLIPAFIFGILLTTCLTAMMCRNVVRYFTKYEPDELADLRDEETDNIHQNNISLEHYQISDQLEDMVSPQNAKQLSLDEDRLRDVVYT